MKQTSLLVVIIAIFSFSSSGQVKKGSVLLGGQLSCNSYKIDRNMPQSDYKRHYGNLSVSAGKAIKDNSVLGLYVGYGTGKEENYSNGFTYFNSRSSNYNAGLFYRRYVKLARDFYFFGEAGGGYSGDDRTDTEVLSGNKTKTNEVGGELFITPGISYRVYRKLQIELQIPRIASLQYTSSKTTAPTPADSYKEEAFNFNTSLSNSLLSSVGVGFRFVL